ncbi:MAG: sugar phosphate nucleotidyltransferase [Clostridia bacterium]|nr:sugar phosphate nucleotidyltransferase [Clostridia bacterium]
MKAIIMAGGEGTRLRPLTCTMPKPMARVMNRPLMEHIIALLKKHGIIDIGVTLMYMPDSIKRYFGDGSAFGVRLTYFCEDTPMGTAGSIKNASRFLDDDFLVISGDALCDIDLSALIDFHRARGAEATLALKSMEIPLEYGVVVTDKAGRILRFLEKPGWSQVFSDTVNTGIYVLSPSVLSVTDQIPCDFSKDIFPRMLAEHKPLYGYVADGYWCDIGDLDAYRHCHYDVFEGRLSLQIHAREKSHGIYVESGAVIEEGAIVHPPALIGKNALIKRGAVVDSYTVIGEGCIVEGGASIKRSVLYSGVSIGRDAQIRGAVLCPHSIVHRGASLFEQSVVGEGSGIGRDAVVRPGVKIWPYKAVGNGEILADNLVWGSAKSTNLFGERSIAGQPGTQLTPFLVQKLGSAVGTMQPGKRIGVSSDGSPCAVMLKHALISGLLSSGAQVYDFGEQPLPITRSGIKVYGAAMGVHIAAYGGSGMIDIMDSRGANIPRQTERKIENLMARGDFSCCDAEKVSAVSDLYEYKLYYLRQIINSVKDKPKKRIMVATANPWGKRLLRAATADLDSEILLLEENLPFVDAERLHSFAENVVRQNCDFGAVLDDACETLLLVDERGRMISRDLYKTLVPLIVMKQFKNARIVVNVSVSGVVEKMAEKYGATLVRTQESPIALMEGLACGEADGEAQFVYYFDGVGAIVQLMDFLQKEKTTLSALVDEIPTFHIIRRVISCGAGDKGRIIRFLSEHAENTETTDGVKILEKGGWVLVLPDAEKPACRVIAHGDTEEYAAELIDLYDEKIQEIIR